MPPLIAPSCTQITSLLLPPLQHTVHPSTRASRAVATSKSMSSRGALLISMKKHPGGGPFATRVPCNPETSVGLQAALVAPESAYLHVAVPVRRSARRIALAVTTRSPFIVDDYCLLCKLCDRPMDDRIIYMYMSMGFCTEECRMEYFLEYRYRLAIGMEAEGRRTRSEARKAPVAEGEAATGHRRMFFISAEV